MCLTASVLSQPVRGGRAHVARATAALVVCFLLAVVQAFTCVKTKTTTRYYTRL